jgi:hypothetical protein
MQCGAAASSRGLATCRPSLPAGASPPGRRPTASWSSTGGCPGRQLLAPAPAQAVAPNPPLDQLRRVLQGHRPPGAAGGPGRLLSQWQPSRPPWSRVLARRRARSWHPVPVSQTRTATGSRVPRVRCVRRRSPSSAGSGGRRTPPQRPGERVRKRQGSRTHLPSWQGQRPWRWRWRRAGYRKSTRRISTLLPGGGRCERSGPGAARQSAGGGRAAATCTWGASARAGIGRSRAPRRLPPSDIRLACPCLLPRPCPCPCP